MRLLAPKTKQSYLFLSPPHSGLGKAVAGIYPGRATTLLLPPPPYRHYRHCPSPTTRLHSLWTASLSSGSDQRRISGCGTGWLLAGPDSLSLWLCRVSWCMCFYVAEVFFLFSHCTPQGAVVGKVHRSSTWVKVQIRIIKYYSSKSKSTAFSILLEWKYKSTQFFMYLSKKVLVDRFILQFYIDYFI